jgi:signal transduction histidine kinase
VGILIARSRRIDLVWVDRMVAVLLTAGAIADAASQPRRELGVVAIGSLVLLTGSIAWRRVDPLRATLVAVSGMIAFAVASRYNGDGSFEVAAIALNFYMLGRWSQGRGRISVPAVALFYWLVGAVVITYLLPGGTVGSVIGNWALAGALPFAAGLTLASRSALTSELEHRTDRLRDEQEIRARRAAAEERNRMARELHDVIAHCVSVMVVQTGAARRVVGTEIDAAREALRVVESSGREALVELRRLVGVLRRGADDLSGSASPGLARLDVLTERAGAAGLPVSLRVEGQPVALSLGLDLVAYRVVQEALTNAIKHAGPACADVSVNFGARVVALKVSDTGRGAASQRIAGDGSGHGLVGMAERVELYGGDLNAGPRPGGGFEVSARIPLDTTVPSPEPVDSRPSAEAVVAQGEASFRWPWMDPLLATGWLVVSEVAILTSGNRRGALALNVLVVAAIALAANWRRRSPLLFLLVVGVLGLVLNTYLIPLKNSPLLGAYFVLVPSYAVAAWAERREAMLGLSFLLAGAAISELITQRGKLGDFAGAAFALCAAWAAGRAIRSYRFLTSELQRTSARLAIEREDRARLAVAGERSRIARELHAAVAGAVAAMVVQAEATLSLLGRDHEQADTAMGAIENTGRLALVEMRRVLGVLRHRADGAELRPQPGVDQIYGLIQRARDGGQSVELIVDGDAGTLGAGVELALYRIVENALGSARGKDQGAVAVSLRFGEHDLELRLTAHCHGPNRWPTDAMRERVAVCGGQVDPDSGDNDGWRFSAHLPRGLQGALA